jgi:branched-chain amino acid aminotransferase
LKYSYTDGKLHSSTAANLSTMSQCVNYGTTAFEGMKAFYRKDERAWFLFRPDQHYTRLCRSAAMLDIDFKPTEAEFVSILSKLIKKNNIRDDVYLRPLVYRTATGVGLMKPSGYGFSIFIEEAPRHEPRKLKCCLVAPRRPVDGTYGVKIAGNYVLSFFAEKEALKKRCDTGIVLSTEGYVSEATRMNLFFVKNGVVHTPSDSCGALEGITRKSVMDILRSEVGAKVREGKYRYKRLGDADEIFFTGTGSGVNLVSRLDGKAFKIDRRKLIASRVWRVYDDIVSGRTSAYQDWLVGVG